MKSILISLFCVVYTLAFSQSKRIEKEVEELFQKGFALEQTNLDSALYYYKRAGDLSRKWNYADGIIRYYLNYTYVLNQKGELKLGLKYNLEALAFSKKKGKKNDVADCLFNVGSSYNNLGEFEKALSYYLEAADLLEELKDKKSLVLLYDNIGGVYTNSLQYQMALNYHKKALQLAESLNDDSQLAKVLINKGITEMFLHQNLEAEKDLKRGMRISEKNEIYFLQSISSTSLSTLYSNQHDYKQSLSYARKAFALAVELKSDYAESESLKALTNAFGGLNESDSAIFYGNKALQFNRENQFNSDLYRVYECLSKAYEQKGDYRNSLFFFQKFKLFTDSLHQKQVTLKMQLVQNKFQKAKSENEILNLESAKEKQSFVILSLTVALIILGMGVFFYYRISRSKRLLIEQEVVSLKNQESLVAANIVLETQEEERLRIAKDLHDGLGGLLSGIKLVLQNNENQGNSKEAMNQLDNAIVEMRRIAHAMVPEALNKFGLIEALTDFCKTISLNAPFTLNYQFFGIKERFSSELETNLYRVILELLNNAIKHSNASEIYLQMILDERTLAVTIEDNGKGFEAKKIMEKGGIGFKNIASRLKLIGGTMEVQSSEDFGTSINIELKL